MPALSKPAEQQGDATKTGRLQKPEVATPEREKPVQSNVDASEDEKPAKDKDDDGDDEKSESRDSGSSKKGDSGHKVEATAGDEKPATKLSIKRIQFSEEIAKRAVDEHRAAVGAVDLERERSEREDASEHRERIVDRAELLLDARELFRELRGVHDDVPAIAIKAAT